MQQRCWRLSRLCNVPAGISVTTPRKRIPDPVLSAGHWVPAGARGAYLRAGMAATSCSCVFQPLATCHRKQSSMQSFLAKCAAVGIVAGGFTLTGDVGRLADRGKRLLDARSVPSETPTEQKSDVESSGATLGFQTPAARSRFQAPLPSGAQGSNPGDTAPQGMASTGEATGPNLSRPTLRETAADAPVGRHAATPAPPTSGPESVELRQLAAGIRVHVWVRRPGATGRGILSTDLIALDIIDPDSAEALEHRHAALTHGNQATTVHATSRRVVISGDHAGRIVRGGTLALAPLHGVNGLGPAEKIGTVLAIELQNR